MKTKIPISSIVLNEDIYPRKRIDQKRVGIFVENIRDGFKFDPIEVEHDPDRPGKYCLLDGAHRWSAYRAVGESEPEIVIKDLKGADPLLYAAAKAIGPKQLTEEEAKQTARRAYNKNSALTSSEIGKAIGRSRQTVDSYIADLRAVNQMGINIKIFRMNRLGISQDRIARRLGVDQKTIHNHLGKMPELAFLLNTDLAKGFTIAQVAEKHGWTEPMVWSLALEGREDIKRFKQLGWGLRTWDLWGWNDCDKRFGDEWPGRIPAQLIAHILFYFSKQNDLVLDPMAGGGATPDTCLALNRRCWAFDMIDCPETRPEIEHHTWTVSKESDQQMLWPIKSKEKPDLIIFDPPYFDKKAGEYSVKSISGLPKGKYLEFLEAFFLNLKRYAKKTTRIAFINADWRDFQRKPAAEEFRDQAIMIDDYLNIINKSGWWHSHVFQAPMSSQRFSPGVVSAMQKKRIVGVISRYVIMLSQKKS